MYTIAFALLAVQATGQAPPCPTGQQCQPWERQWQSDPVVGTVVQGNGRMTIPDTPRLGPGRHELVVHWPAGASGTDYRRVFGTGNACLKARAAILEEHRRRAAAAEADATARGLRMIGAPAAPYAICVPLGE
jgi:hypothetical protein